MTGDTALLYANVLYPAPIRDILLQLAATDFHRARWTAAIHDEWIAALLRNEPHRNRASLERTRDLIDLSSTRDCLITGFAHLVPSLTLPDANDRHILAAAIVGRCDAIVTQNLRDFPVAVLALLGIEAKHPNAFLRNQFSLAPGPRSARQSGQCGYRLKHPPFTVPAYLDQLIRQGLVATVAELEPFVGLL